MNAYTIELETGVFDAALRQLGDTRLTPNEAKLLGYLAERAGDVINKATLLQEVFGYEPGVESRTLYSTIDRLRHKVERDPKHPRHLITVGRDGYSFRALEGPAVEAGSDAYGFVGRKGERLALLRLLEARGVVTVWGPGGVGKTRLVSELGEQAFVEVSPEASVAELVASVGRELAVPVTGEVERDLVRLGRLLKGRRLVLDNAEASLRATAALAAELSDAGVGVLVTSRQVLGLAEEVVFELGPLVPDEAIALFARRAQRVADGEAAAQVVERLDRLPLAIELVARWTRLFALPELLKRLDALPLVATAGDGHPSRHRSLQDVVEASWQAVSPRAQQALADATVFRGPFTVEAAEAVLTGGLVALEELIDGSLVQLREGRCSMLGVVAAFAAVRAGDVDAALQRHAAWFAKMGSEAALRELRLGGTAALRERRAELADLMAAVGHGTVDQSAGAALAAAMMLRTLGPVGGSIPLLESVLQRGPSPRREVRLELMRGVALRYDGRPEEGFVALERARELAADHAPDLSAQAWEALGVARQYHGGPRDGDALLERALVLHREAGDRYGEAAVLAERAGGQLRGGHAAEAIEGYHKALALFRELGARHAEAVYLGNLGIAQMKCARYEAGQASLEGSLALHRSLGSIRFVGQTECNLGLLHVMAGRPDEGVRHYEASLEAAARAGDLKDEAITRANLAWLQIRRGALVDARRHLDLAAASFELQQLPLQILDATLTRAKLLRAEQDLDGAMACVIAADALAAEHGFGEVVPRVYAERGLVAHAQGAVPDALEWLRRAEEALVGFGAGNDATEAVGELRALLAPG